MRFKNFLLIVCLIFAHIVEAKQQRSYHVIKEFKLLHPCPANVSYKGHCEGYIIDHIKPLACGGIDSPKNMQWQSKADARIKDKWERIGC